MAFIKFELVDLVKFHSKIIEIQLNWVNHFTALCLNLTLNVHRISLVYSFFLYKTVSESRYFFSRISSSGCNSFIIVIFSNFSVKFNLFDKMKRFKMMVTSVSETIRKAPNRRSPKCIRITRNTSVERGCLSYCRNSAEKLLPHAKFH